MTAVRAEGLDPGGLDAGALDITISPMKRRHLRRVLRIENQVYPRPWSYGLYLTELALRPARVYLVATADARFCGYAGAMIIGDDAHITTIAVDPRLHGRTIGTRLLAALTRQAVASGVKNLSLEVRMSNAAAQAMYRRFGYAPAGVRKNYYAEVKEDALVMWAHDVDGPAYAARLRGIEDSLAGSTTIEGHGG